MLINLFEMKGKNKKKENCKKKEDGNNVLENGFKLNMFMVEKD
jgi:hypothetical protein